jgi:hypothetical protein
MASHRTPLPAKPRRQPGRRRRDGKKHSTSNAADVGGENSKRVELSELRRSLLNVSLLLPITSSEEPFFQASDFLSGWDCRTKSDKEAL